MSTEKLPKAVIIASQAFKSFKAFTMYPDGPGYRLSGLPDGTTRRITEYARGWRVALIDVKGRETWLPDSYPTWEAALDAAGRTE